MLQACALVKIVEIAVYVMFSAINFYKRQTLTYLYTCILHVLLLIYFIDYTTDTMFATSPSTKRIF